MDLGSVKSEQIVLCSPPMLSWNSRRGYWPCAYNWNSAQGNWKLADLVECKTSLDGWLQPELPSWWPGGRDVERTFSRDYLKYKMNGILLFRREDATKEDAFFVFWGQKPGDLDGITSGREWWHSTGGYFCLAMGWEEFTQAPCEKAKVDQLMREWHDASSQFLEALLQNWKRAIGRQFEDTHETLIGAVDRGALVTASVKLERFLEVEGLVVQVDIK